MSNRNFARRFFVDQPIEIGQLEIVGPTAHHVANVLRGKPGDQIFLFNGQGGEWIANIVETEKRRLRVDVVEMLEVSRELPFRLGLAVAMPKGERQKVLVEKLVEIGVSYLIPFNSKRSVAKSDGKSVERMNRWVIEASKQCGRNTLMTIREPVTALELFEMAELAKCFIAHPYGEAILASQAAKELEEDQEVMISVGPEGGFDLAEVERAMQLGWQPIKIAPSILRVETAAATLASIFGPGRL